MTEELTFVQKEEVKRQLLDDRLWEHNVETDDGWLSVVNIKIDGADPYAVRRYVVSLNKQVFGGNNEEMFSIVDGAVRVGYDIGDLMTF